ncbi:OLC1v1005741C1 [Oldenlandia corymbosa var. corymbosa]|uniref:OLC1v1005741C1 n=1 Tax=Oldenlandia corymbosa var. corymbosa TaxID=529605 RepID=A0AAV1DHR2_OLDCO|nr:OLC1v1005741C1 [Oldenlandia corymbosa var. corymbosa]
MAQKRDKEETELKVPESLPLCTPTIPVPQPPPPQLTGSTDDSRSNSARSPETSDPNRASVQARSLPDRSDLGQLEADKQEGTSVEVNRSLKRPREAAANRCSCSGCRRKLGLMGFRCRCGDMFCFEHRYTDRHDCSYDYKAAGREAIAKENPVVKAAKILKV